MELVWKPLDIGGLRLYRVTVEDAASANQGLTHYIVLETSPEAAAKLIATIHPTWDGWIVRGHPIDVLMPKEWWEDGIPLDDSTKKGGDTNGS